MAEIVELTLPTFNHTLLAVLKGAQEIRACPLCRQADFLYNARLLGDL